MTDGFAVVARAFGAVGLASSMPVRAIRNEPTRIAAILVPVLVLGAALLFVPFLKERKGTLTRQVRHGFLDSGAGA